jgi:hypothetical protein
MTPDHQTLIVSELHRLESLNYVGLLGTKYLSSTLTATDDDGNRVRAININPAGGWAIVAYGRRGEEQKHKFLKDIEGGWHFDGVETAETVH